MPVDVINPDSTDPLALSDDRDEVRSRDATASVNTTRGQTIPGSETFVPEEPLLSPEPEPEPVVLDRDITNANRNNPSVPRVYPNIPANIIPPTELNLGALQGNQSLIDSILQQAQGLQLEDEFQLDHQLSTVFNTGTPFGPNRPLFQEPDLNIPENPYPQLLEDAREYRAQQAANNISPVGIDPNTGEVIPGTRNVLVGQPLSRLGQAIRQFTIGDTGTAFEDSLTPGQPLRNLGRRFSDVYRGYSSAFQTNQGRRFLRGVTSVVGLRGLTPNPAPADRSLGNLGALSERVIASAQLDPRLQGVALPFTPTQQFDPLDPTFLETLTDQSLLTRDLFTGLSSSQGQTGDEFFAPRKGRFGDFGNAGILSLLLYGANAPEGIASGALYELTNFAIDNFTDHETPPDRVRLFDALYGRDLGFMNVANNARYLSFVDGDDHIGLLSRIGITNGIAQNAAGFVTDVIWGSFTDFGLSTALKRINRSFIDPAVGRALPLQTLDADRIQRAVRNLTEGVDTPAQSVISVNRAIDDAINARRLTALPLRATPEVDAIVRGTRRNLIIDSDGIPLNVKLRPIRESLEQFVPTRTDIIGNAIDEISVARIAEVEQSLLDTQFEITTNISLIEEARTNLRSLMNIDDSPLSEFSGTQIEIIRTNERANQLLNDRINNLLAERRQLNFATGQFQQLATKEIFESAARGNTRVVGDVLETINIDPNLEATIPLIPKISIEPSIPLPVILDGYRLDPGAFLPTQLTLTRRTDDQLTELAKFHNIISPDSPTLSPQQLQFLQNTHPTLLSRYGNPIDNNLSSPAKRIEITPPDPIRNTPQRSIIPDVETSLTTRSLDELPDVPNRVVNNISRRRQKLVERLARTRDFAEQDVISDKIDVLDRRLQEIVSQSNPRSVSDFYVQSLPRRSTPLTPESTGLARDLAAAESRYIESAQAARNVQRQLIDAQEILNQQGRTLEELPPIERATLQDEVATRNNFVPNGDGIPTIASRTPEVDDIPVTPTTRFDPNPDADTRAINEGQERLAREAEIPEATTDSGFVSEMPDNVIARSERVTRQQIEETLTQGNPGQVALLTHSQPMGFEDIAGRAPYLVGEFTGDVTVKRNRRIYHFRLLGDQRDELGQRVIKRINLQIHAFTTPDVIPAGESIVDVVSRPAVDLIASDDVPRSLDSHLQNNGIWYHGTKSRINSLSTTDYTLGSSLTNELGPGLYLTTDPALGEVFAKAQPSIDRVPNPSLRSQNIGELRQVVMTDPSSNLIDGGSVLPPDSPIRTLFIGLVRDEMASRLSPAMADRLVSNARNLTKKPFREWFQGFRVQWNRVRNNAQSELVQFNSDFVRALRTRGFQGSFYRHSNGHYTVALYNDLIDTPLSIQELRRTSVGTGAPEEQVLNRYHADLHARNEVSTRTNTVNLEASRLNVDNRVVQNLKEAAKDAYRQSLDDTEDMLQLNRTLDEVVDRETKQQISDINENGPRQASNQLRRFRGDNNAPCI